MKLLSSKLCRKRYRVQFKLKYWIIKKIGRKSKRPLLKKPEAPA